MIETIPANDERGVTYRLPYPPPPISVAYRWGCFTLSTEFAEVRLFDPLEVLTTYGMSDDEAILAIEIAKAYQGEPQTFSFERRPQ